MTENINGRIDAQWHVGQRRIHWCPLHAAIFCRLLQQHFYTGDINISKDLWSIISRSGSCDVTFWHRGGACRASPLHQEWKREIFTLFIHRQAWVFTFDEQNVITAPCSVQNSAPDNYKDNNAMPDEALNWILILNEKRVFSWPPPPPLPVTR